MKNTTAAIIGILVLIVLVFGAYYIGIRHAMAPTATSTPSGATTTTTTTTTVSTGTPGSNYYQDTSTWQTVREDQAGFTLKYPGDFKLNEFGPTPSTDWRLNSQDPGIKVLSITIPASFDPQSNLVDATLTVGYSKNNKAIADCMTPDPSGLTTASSTVTINGSKFTKFTFSDAGAGQRYDSASYRTLHAGACYAIEYTVHSGAIENYPASQHLHQYDSAKITSVLDRIVSTFAFL